MAAVCPFKINNIALDGKSTLPALKEGGAVYSRQAIDSANTGRNQEGAMIRDLITQKDKWKLDFMPCTASQLNALLNQIENTFFNFTAPNVGSSTTETKSFYVGDRSATLKTIKKNGEYVWENVSFDIIQR